VNKGRIAARSAVVAVVAVAATLLCAGCGAGEPDSAVRNKLDIIVAADLKAIVGELPKESIRDSAFSRIMEYVAHEKGIYRVRAVVDFYYLRGVHIKRTVKYRYVKSARKWERYENEYRFYSDSTAR
jgi:hypothetical protein